MLSTTRNIDVGIGSSGRSGGGNECVQRFFLRERLPVRKRECSYHYQPPSGCVKISFFREGGGGEGKKIMYKYQPPSGFV